MRDTLGNYACPLLVLDFSSSVQQSHTSHTVEDKAAACFTHSKNTSGASQHNGTKVSMSHHYITYKMWKWEKTLSLYDVIFLCL